LVGVVNKVGTEHIGMLVHGMFNVSVPRDADGGVAGAGAGAGADGKAKKGGKKRKASAVEVSLEDRVEFTVTAVKDARGLLAIEGVIG
jgi:hypothetical protein